MKVRVAISWQYSRGLDRPNVILIHAFGIEVTVKDHCQFWNESIHPLILGNMNLSLINQQYSYFCLKELEDRGPFIGLWSIEAHYLKPEDS